ncbi:hypothetical protein D8674_013016 [Pyrus ussuriensis x Pyrus communis]|uniref:Uncharacterized protein n=1 Tax=Pyrus ussuriensis x Pyrus communis TaxID=2448454 RepID=A0A5N5GQX5_9ROSA|nr:uncharacterized protein LOC103939724 isoform X2 [Pyrus x bretschneideri]KAB2617113.1 hypothetical protein D8674_012982 [Pyrus ussuriensis x Pyrus communis]KAB2617147.1 hypothetical protein D8674_013016 [Pyrus ussuriensis x Pyrus communis]
MEGAGGETQTKNGGGGVVRSDVAIRSAKAALLLSSLKSSPNRRFSTAIDDDDEIAEEKEMLKKEIGDLKVTVARERLRNKRIKVCGLLEILLQLALLFAISAFLFMLVIEDGES